MEQERRDAKRRAFRLEVEVWGHKGPNRITDLSTRGVFIYTEGPSQFNPGDKIDLVLKFPTQEEAMLLKAQVTRVGEEGIGVKFINLTPDHAKVIEDSYAAVKETTPPGES
jgi:hypothetical protein